MLQQITPESYREQKIKEIEERKNIITENYLAFWNIAKRLQELKTDGVIIETPFGDFSFIKKLRG